MLQCAGCFCACTFNQSRLYSLSTCQCRCTIGTCSSLLKYPLAAIRVAGVSGSDEYSRGERNKVQPCTDAALRGELTRFISTSFDIEGIGLRELAAQKIKRKKKSWLLTIQAKLDDSKGKTGMWFWIWFLKGRTGMWFWFRFWHRQLDWVPLRVELECDLSKGRTGMWPL